MLNFNGPLHESLIWFLQILLQAGHPWSSWWQAIGLQVWTKFPWMERLKECYWCISQIPRTASIPCEIEPPWHAQLSSYDEMWHAQEERKEQGTNRTSKIRRDEVGESSWFQRCCECVHLNKKCVSSHKSSQTSKYYFDVCMTCLHVCQKINTKTFEKGSYICTVKKSSVNGKLCLFHSLIQFTTSCIQECVFNDLLDNFTLKRKIQNMTWNELNF